jgi:transposase
VKVDAYGVEGGVYLGSERIRASCCLAHARRKFDEAKSSHPRLAAEALGFFQQLYDIEDRARDFTPAARQALRQAEAVPLLAMFRVWADEQAPHTLPKLKIGEALGYLRNQWEALTNYVEDGRLPIDNNGTERDLRALTIGRKNWLFIGSKEAGPRAAILYTVVASAARHDLDIWAYLCDVLQRLARGNADLASLLPDAWAAAIPKRSAPTAPTNAKPPPPPPAPAANAAAPWNEPRPTATSSARMDGPGAYGRHLWR